MRFVRFLLWFVRDTMHRFAAYDRIAGKVTVGENVRVFAPDRLESAPGVYLDTGAYLHCGDASWCRGQGSIRIGEGSYIGPHCILFGMGEIDIGKKVMIAPNAVISTVQHPYTDTSVPMFDQPRVYGRIVIEDDVYIASNVVVTPSSRRASTSARGPSSAPARS